ncbi:hypothetical protein F3I50_20355 [Pantoea sp. M_5]|nr:hypothetical protein F3I50_20355 [Pantoea sp. M_5]
MAQEYNIEQLNHGRKVVDFMRWDKLAFIISGIATSMFTAIIGTRAIVNLVYGGKRINKLSI